MTPDQARAVMEVLPLSAWAQVIAGVGGLSGDRGQLVLDTPGGVVEVVVQLTNPLPLPVAEIVALAAQTESQIRTALAPFEVDVGRGFNSDGRGALRVQRGYRAGEGWV